MFNFFRQKRRYDLQWLGTDMHLHLLPGIDDGCADMATARHCLEGLCMLGLHTFICTPHRYPPKYPNNRIHIEQALHALTQYLHEIPLSQTYTLAAAAEYMLDDDIVSILRPEECMPLSDNLLLVELPWSSKPYYAEDSLFKLLTAAKQPVLAHPERYAYYFNNKEQLVRFREMGVHLQVNLLSLSGYYGQEPKRIAHWLVNKQMVDFVGTDLHHGKHLEALAAYCHRTDTETLLRDNPIKNKLLRAQNPMEKSAFSPAVASCDQPLDLRTWPISFQTKPSTGLLIHS